MNELVLERRMRARNTGRVLFLCGAVNELMAAETISQLMEMQAKDPLEDIMMIIDSYGGELFSCISLINAMNLITCDVSTVVLGKAMSAGAMIFAHGTKGKRFMAPNSRLMLHQVSAGTDGTVKDMTIEIEEFKTLQSEMVELLTKRCNLNTIKMKKLMDRNAYLTPAKAIKMGICDKMITKIS